jgi:SAM-dependent methyltransferase
MDVTNRFVLEFARTFAKDHPGVPILDYGCGAGTLVRAALADNLPMQGADVFYGGADARAEGPAITKSAMGGCHFLSAPSASSSTIQVMEHVEDLDAVLAEIHRVLLPGGVLLRHFSIARRLPRRPHRHPVFALVPAQLPRAFLLHLGVARRRAGLLEGAVSDRATVGS